MGDSNKSPSSTQDIVGCVRHPLAFPAVYSHLGKAGVPLYEAAFVVGCNDGDDTVNLVVWDSSGDMRRELNVRVEWDDESEADRYCKIQLAADLVNAASVPGMRMAIQAVRADQESMEARLAALEVIDPSYGRVIPPSTDPAPSWQENDKPAEPEVDATTPPLPDSPDPNLESPADSDL